MRLSPSSNDTLSLRQTSKKLATAVKASSTSLTQVFGVGPVIAGTVIGDVADVSRFPGCDHFAPYNSTAPVEASSGNGRSTGCRCAAAGVFVLLHLEQGRPVPGGCRRPRVRRPH